MTPTELSAILKTPIQWCQQKDNVIEYLALDISKTIQEISIIELNKLTSMTLDDYLLKQSKEQLITIMEKALDYMQSYNSYSITYCIVKGCGGKAIEQEDGSYKYTLPKYS